MALVVIASSLYFLYLPNGFQGGRNPYYEIIILFARETWDVLHTWSGILMILISLIAYRGALEVVSAYGAPHLEANPWENRKIKYARACQFVGQFSIGNVIRVVRGERGVFFVCFRESSG